MSPKFTSAAVVMGALRVKRFIWVLKKTHLGTQKKRLNIFEYPHVLVEKKREKIFFKYTFLSKVVYFLAL